MFLFSWMCMSISMLFAITYDNCVISLTSCCGVNHRCPDYIFHAVTERTCRWIDLREYFKEDMKQKQKQD